VRGVKIAMCHYKLRPNQFKELRNENLLNSQSHCVEPERTAEFNLHRLQMICSAVMASCFQIQQRQRIEQCSRTRSIKRCFTTATSHLSRELSVRR